MTSLFSRGPERATESTWLDEHAERWLDQGLVTPDQVAAIRAYEQTETGTEAGPRFTLMAELAVYLGSVVALMSGAMIVGRSSAEHSGATSTGRSRC